MAEKDTDAELVNLMKEVNREIGFFAFILTDLNLETQTALFRLNNPALTEKEQQVKVGDLLQQRFRVVAINTGGVVLEDTHPEAAGRQPFSKNAARGTLLTHPRPEFPPPAECNGDRGDGSQAHRRDEKLCMESPRLSPAHRAV